MKNAPIDGGGGGAPARVPTPPSVSAAAPSGALDPPTPSLLDAEDAQWMQAAFLSLDGGVNASVFVADRPAIETPSKTPRLPGRVPTDSKQDVPYAQLSPKSRRKRRNRDLMRQVRLKERESMDQLRATAARLETQYQAITSASDAHTAATNSQPYAQLISTASRLKDDNFRLRKALDDKFKLQETLERVHTDCLPSNDAQEPHTAPKLDASHQQDDKEDHETFTPLSSAYITARMRGTLAQSAAIREALTRCSAAERAPFFGWRVRLQSQAHWLLFAFDKPFPQATARNAMQEMWDRERGMHSYRGASELARQSMSVVQSVDDDTYVFQRRLSLDGDPLYASGSSSASGSPVVSTYLRFRLETPAGFAIGLTSVAPTVSMCQDSSDSEEEEEEDVWGADLCLWTEFEAVEATTTGRESCVARISGRTNARNAAFRHRAAADCVIGLLRWESANMGPMFAFTC